MRLRILLILCFVALAYAGGKKQGVLFTVRNPLPVQRTMETVSVNLTGFYQFHPEWKDETLTIFKAETEFVSQMIDNDQDGTPDELIFQASFGPNETRQFEIYRTPAASVKTETKVDVRYVLPREDVAWENDRIAFRIYGSVLAGNVDNGTDVWTKRVRYPIVHKWYEGEEQVPKIVYHEDHGEGADFFSVGRSLGAGSAGIVWQGKLIQPGLFSQHRVITNGPLRMAVEVLYPNFRIDTVRTTLVKRITLDAGSQLNRIEETYISNSNGPTLMRAAGLVNRAGTVVHYNEQYRTLSLWGAVNQDTVNGSLGTGIVIPPGAPTAFSKDSIQFYITSAIPKGKQSVYYAGAAWTRMGDITSQEQWDAYLADAAKRLEQPLIITFKR